MDRHTFPNPHRSKDQVNWPLSSCIPHHRTSVEQQSLDGKTLKRASSLSRLLTSLGESQGVWLFHGHATQT